MNDPHKVRPVACFSASSNTKNISFPLTCQTKELGESDSNVGIIQERVNQAPKENNLKKSKRPASAYVSVQKQNTVSSY